MSVNLQDSATIVLNKPPKLPVKGNLPIHNIVDTLAATALSFDYEDGPKLVHRLDKESSGILLMGRTKESITRLHWLFCGVNLGKSSSKIPRGARFVGVPGTESTENPRGVMVDVFWEQDELGSLYTSGHSKCETISSWANFSLYGLIFTCFHTLHIFMKELLLWEF